MGRSELVETDLRLAEVVGALSRGPRVAVDIESNGFFRHRERVCLVQLAAGDAAFIVDPLTIQDVQPLAGLLADRSVEKLFHAGDNDLRSIDREWGFRVHNLFDTSIAAAFTGAAQLGLQSVLREWAGVELAKSKRLQRSDWTLRPLSPEALKYAANDVLHLSRARDALSAQLRKLSRLEWVEEEFTRLEDVRYSAPDREFAFLGVKGSRDLDGRGLAILRSLCRFREQEASRLDRPLFKVVPDAALVQLSSEPGADLASVKGLGRYARLPASSGLKAALDEGNRAVPFQRPQRPRADEVFSPEERKAADARLRSLKAWRSEMGQRLRLNPGLLWPAVSLERLARRPDSLDSELGATEVRNWQRREFGVSLRTALAGLGRGALG